MGLSTFLVGVLFLPETKDRDIHATDRDAPRAGVRAARGTGPGPGASAARPRTGHGGPLQARALAYTSPPRRISSAG
jgi:hypothetical protein